MAQGYASVYEGKQAGSVVQVKNWNSVTSSTTTTVIPFDDTIPQITEGSEFMALAITPSNASNKLRIDVVVNLSHSTSTNPVMVAALFQDSTADALACGMSRVNEAAADRPLQVTFTHWMTAGTTSATAFRVRCGADDAGTTTFNGNNAARVFGGVLASSITITEYKV
jgi:hypothetical protein